MTIELPRSLPEKIDLFKAALGRLPKLLEWWDPANERLSWLIDGPGQLLH
jgi:hypothetical protein